MRKILETAFVDRYRDKRRCALSCTNQCQTLRRTPQRIYILSFCMFLVIENEYENECTSNLFLGPRSIDNDHHDRVCPSGVDSSSIAGTAASVACLVLLVLEPMVDILRHSRAEVHRPLRSGPGLQSKYDQAHPDKPIHTDTRRHTHARLVISDANR